MQSLVVLALPLLFIWTTTGTHVSDSLTLRVFNKDFSMSDAEMHKVLKEANLESHGYKLEVTTKETSKPGSSTPGRVTTHFYYKIVPCAKVLEIEQEIDKLVKDIESKIILKTKSRMQIVARKHHETAGPPYRCELINLWFTSMIEFEFYDDFYGWRNTGLRTRRKTLEAQERTKKLYSHTIPSLGILGSSVARKMKKDVINSKLNSGKLCKAGLEVHFRNEQSCGQKKARLVKRGCWWSSCNVCSRVTQL